MNALIQPVMKFNEYGFLLYDLALTNFKDGKASKPDINDFIVIDPETNDFMRGGYAARIDGTVVYGESRKDVVREITFYHMCKSKNVKYENKILMNNTVN